MTVLFEEMTREQLKEVAPRAIGVIPTAATEQHGPHLAVGTDTLLCTTVAQRAAEQVADRVPVVVTPPQAFGSSHHHIPFGGVLSLTSDSFISVVRQVAEGLSRTGFRKIVIINGHGGNKDHVGVVGQDLVNRFDLPAAVASCSYWNLAHAPLEARNLLPAARIPGHAGQFETSMVMALRPHWVDTEALARLDIESEQAPGLDVDLSGAVVQTHGVWQAGPGYSDNPAEASAELGEALLEVVVAEVVRLYVEFDRASGPVIA